MKVVFKGMLVKREKGCRSCGAKAQTEYGFADSRRFILPSGKTRLFYMNEPVEVAERDGEFLLSYNYADANGLTRQVFEKVE